MALRQQLSQKLEQGCLLNRFTPKLLQVPTMELDQRIKQEIEENPALEEGKDHDDDDFSNEDSFEEGDGEEFDISDYLDDDVADYKTKSSNHSKDDDDKVIPFSGGHTFRERLSDQLQLFTLDDTQKIIAVFLLEISMKQVI